MSQILWVSVSSDLRIDAVRDLEDVGADSDGIHVHPRVRLIALALCRSPRHDSLIEHLVCRILHWR